MPILRMTQKEIDACLFEACESGAINYARLALASGANVYASDKSGVLPWEIAIAMGHDEVAKLVEAAAKQQDHAARVKKDRSDKGPPRIA